MIATFIVCLTLLVLAERARPLLVRLIKLAEYRTASVLITDAPAGPTVPPLPRDLSAKVDACKEGWERSDLLGAITEHYLEARPLVETDDEAWIAVRRRLRVDE